jgi:hypothetical protein
VTQRKREPELIDYSVRRLNEIIGLKHPDRKLVFQTLFKALTSLEPHDPGFAAIGIADLLGAVMAASDEIKTNEFAVMGQSLGLITAAYAQRARLDHAQS